MTACGEGGERGTLLLDYGNCLLNRGLRRKLFVGNLMRHGHLWSCVVKVSQDWSG